MLGLHLPSASKAALIAVTGLMLSLGATASYADNAEQIGIARGGAQVSTHSTARALYPNPSFVPNEADRSNECIGGYRWVQRAFDAGHTPGELALPLPCR